MSRAVLCGVACAAALAPISANAWVCQDAFITLRYVENLHEGRGLVFNAGERVQGFTHPLWTLLLALCPTEYLYYGAIVAGLICTAGTLALLCALLVRTRAPWIGIVTLFAVLACSRSFVEWSTSGLENSLTHLLLLATALAALPPRARDKLPRNPHVRIREPRAADERVGTSSDAAGAPRVSGALALAFGLVLFNRIDQLPLVAPLIVYALWRDWRAGRLRAAALRLAGGLAPLVLWLLFAAFYYGFPLPNTSYAKLTAMTWAARLSAAQAYFADIARWEPALTLAILALVVGVPLLIALPSATERATTRHRRRWLACLALGGALHLGYIVSVGGDYMRGRFLTGLLVIALVAIVVAAAAAVRWRRALATALCVLLLAGSAYGALRWVTDEQPFDPASGVARVSHNYNAYDDLAAQGRKRTLSNIRRTRRSLTPAAQFAACAGPRPVLWSNLGDDTFGFGRDVPIIDPLGLTDPFIARCRPSRVNRAGHVQRNIPRAYLEARGVLNLSENWPARAAACDPSLAAELRERQQRVGWTRPRAKQVYDELAILTRGPLFTWERLKLIAKYTFARPLAYDPRDDFPALHANELPAGMVVIDDALRDTVACVGVEPPQIDFSEPATSGKCWLGPDIDGELALVVRTTEPLRVRLEWQVEALGAALPTAGACTLHVLIDARVAAELRIAETGVHAAMVDLPAQVSVIRLRIADAAGRGRYALDPRPLMLFVGGVRIGRP
ncbi:MAG: hypothetical protein AB7Q17_06005 [Phycisphaerae bacterium]